MTSATLSPAALVAPAAAPMLALVRDLDRTALDAPTPCTDFDVRGLLGHIAQWAPVLDGAGRKAAAAPGPADAALTADLLDQLARTWQDPTAWVGSAPFGADPLPAATVGGMVLGEFVVHGWDLGRALGADLAWPDDVLAYLLTTVTGTAEMARQMGVFGPEVPVPATAPTLDRLLGVSGRDPWWHSRHPR